MGLVLRIFGIVGHVRQQVLRGLAHLPVAIDQCGGQCGVDRRAAEAGGARQVGELSARDFLGTLPAVQETRS